MHIEALKEELDWVIDKWPWVISKFKTVIPLRNKRIKPF